MEAEAGKRRGIPAVAEILGYVGGALALAAVAALIISFWGQIGILGRVGICAGVAVVGIGGGYAMSGLASDAAARLRQFLWFVGVAGVGGAVGLAVNEVAKNAGAVDPTSSDWGWFAGFVAAAIVGGLIWWRNRTWLQHAAFGLGVGLGALMIVPLLEPTVNRLFPGGGLNWGAGAVLALTGVIWGYLGWKGHLPPDNAAWALASMGLLGGIEIMALSNTGFDGAGGLLDWALWLGLAVSVAMLVASVYGRLNVLLGFGCLGVVGFAAELIFELFDGRAVLPVALLSLGAVLVSIAVAVAVVSRKTGEAAGIPLVSEVLGYVGGSLIAGGVAALVATYFDELGSLGRPALLGVAAAAALGGAIWVGRRADEHAERLQQYLFVIASGLAAGAAGVIAYDIALNGLGAGSHDVEFRAEPWGFNAGFVTGAVLCGLTWWRRPSVFTQIVFGALTYMAAGTITELLPGEWPADWWRGGALSLCVAIPWFALTFARVMKPPNTAYGVSSVMLLMALMSLTTGPEGEPIVPVLLAGVLLSVAMLAGSLWLRRGVLLGAGALGVMIFSLQWVMSEFQGKVAGPLILLIVGGIFVVLAVFVAAVLPRIRRTASPEGDS